MLHFKIIIDLRPRVVYRLWDGIKLWNHDLRQLIKEKSDERDTMPPQQLTLAESACPVIRWKDLCVNVSTHTTQAWQGTPNAQQAWHLLRAIERSTGTRESTTRDSQVAPPSSKSEPSAETKTPSTIDT